MQEDYYFFASAAAVIAAPSPPEVKHIKSRYFSYKVKHQSYENLITNIQPRMSIIAKQIKSLQVP